MRNPNLYFNVQKTIDIDIDLKRNYTVLFKLYHNIKKHRRSGIENFCVLEIHRMKTFFFIQNI